MLCLPSVQLIGAQKAGTSAIADWLFEQGGFQRPRVFQGEPRYYSKEVHFFDIDSRFHQGLEFYAKRFQPPPQNPKAVSGQADEYFQKKTNSIVPTRMMDATPDTLQFANECDQSTKQPEAIRLRPSK